MSRGFTILEVLLVLALGTALVGVVVPVGLRYYQTQVFDETTILLVSVLTRAQGDARLGRDDAAHGVKFLPDRFVRFTGTSYAMRDPSRDEIFPLPSGATLISLPDEFVFAEVTGIPNATGTALFSLYGNTRTITIEAGGIISAAPDG